MNYFTKEKSYSKLAVAILVAAMTFAASITASAHDRTRDDDNDDGIWCNNVVRRLIQAKEQSNYLYQSDQFVEAADTLLQGLASASESRREGLMTSEAIAHGLQLGTSIYNNTDEHHGASYFARATSMFLSEYYDFIIDVAQNLDQTQIIPFRRCQESCDPAKFEYNYVRFAKRELEIVLKTLTVPAGPYERGVIPVASTRVFINALEDSTDYAVTDLENSLFHMRFACAIRDLKDLSVRLKNHSLGSSEMTVNLAYEWTKEIVDSINPGEDCGRR